MYPTLVVVLVASRRNLLERSMAASSASSTMRFETPSVRRETELDDIHRRALSRGQSIDEDDVEVLQKTFPQLLTDKSSDRIVKAEEGGTHWDQEGEDGLPGFDTNTHTRCVTSLPPYVRELGECDV